jgi:hypothetical protein
MTVSGHTLLTGVAVAMVASGLLAWGGPPETIARQGMGVVRGRHGRRLRRFFGAVENKRWLFWLAGALVAGAYVGQLTAMRSGRGSRKGSGPPMPG